MSKHPIVLVVDDDKAISDLVSASLGYEGYWCETAISAEEAVAKLKDQNFDALLLDIALPGISGIELLTMSHPQPTAVVMMTAVNDLEVAVKAMKLGALDYIVKPFTVNRLVTSIGLAIEKCSRDRPALNEMDAIAFGVDAQVDYFDFHSKLVTEKTIDVAKRIGLHAEEIEKWAVSRSERHQATTKYLDSLVSKLERSFIAQLILGFDHSACDYFTQEGQKN
jgi:DNA-binding response OmpR family regulator